MVVDYGVKGRVVVELADKQLVTSLPDHVIVLGGAGPCPVLSVSDYVLVRARSKNGPHPSSFDESCDYYIPGTVVTRPEDLRKAKALYSVLLFNNKGISCPRYGIIKVGKSKYQEMCAFIKERASSRPTRAQSPSIRIPSVHDLADGTSHPGSRSSSQHSLSHSGSRVSLTLSHSGSRVSPVHHSASTPQEMQDPSLDKSDEMEKILEQQTLQGELLEHQQKELSRVLLRQQNLEAELKIYKEAANGWSPGQDGPLRDVNTPTPSIPEATELLQSASQQQNIWSTPRSSPLPPPSLGEGLTVTMCDQAVNTEDTSLSPGEEEVGEGFPVTMCEQAVNTDVMTEEKGISTDPIMESRGVGTEWSDSDDTSLSMPPSPLHSDTDQLRSPLPSFSPSPAISLVHTPSATPPRHRSPPHQPESTPTKSPGNLSGSILDSTLTQGQLFPPEEEGDPLINQQVLARWPDDGWYYRGLVVRHLRQMWYQVTDAAHDLETIHAADIIIDLQDAQKPLQAGDTVAALHPSYDFSYAPGQVTGTTADGFHFTVELYDGTKTFLPRQDIYRLAPAKHSQDVGYLREREKAWVGQIVVARRERDGLYTQGK